uniref:EGF-like domain-containing protein n=1 Tax=Acrobeloides nanus TaxID=290746 RepID=A0A914CD78_9BILA
MDCCCGWQGEHMQKGDVVVESHRRWPIWMHRPTANKLFPIKTSFSPQKNVFMPVFLDYLLLFTTKPFVNLLKLFCTTILLCYQGYTNKIVEKSMYFLPTAARHRRELRHKLLCLNGTEVNGKCICYTGYLGTHCERKMYCETFEITANGSCVNCQEGYTGDHCESLICEHGEEHESEQRCVCENPYSGRFCEELTTDDVYLHYNSKMYMIGPLGVLLVIPMILFYYLCERKAHMRQVKRIEKSWSEQTQMCNVLMNLCIVALFSILLLTTEAAKWDRNRDRGNEVKDKAPVYVQTPRGRIRGYVSQLPNLNPVNVFEGVPFAEPPLGKLRFKQLESKRPWRQTWNATFYRPACMSNTSHTRSPQKNIAEDCLYVNIFADRRCNVSLGMS